MVMDEAPIFRASKKRKFGRQKQPENPKRPTENVSDGNSDEEPSAVTLIKSRRHKPRHGVQFSNTLSSRDDDLMIDGSSNAVVKATPEDEHPLRDMTTRFTASTGQVVDVNQHMMEYIDSQIAQRKQAEVDASRNQSRHGQAVVSSDDEGEDSNEAASDIDEEENRDTSPNKSNNTTTTTIPAHNQPYHLAEVSLATLPPTSTGKPPAHKTRPPRKPKLGRDGKPLRPRPRKQVNSADQARDRLVEQILAENRLDNASYASGPPTSELGSNPATKVGGEPQSTNDTQEDADERMAADFRRDFFEGMAERRARTNHGSSATNKKSTAAGGAHVPDGPKLGGSRSARAKMQAAIMAEKEKKK